MVWRWDSEDFSYCYLVPLVFLYLVYINRQTVSNIPIRSSQWGLLFLIAAGFLYIGGERGSVETFSYVAVWMTIVGLTLVVMGWHIFRRLVFPFIILAFIVPLPHFLNNIFTFRLKLASSVLSVNMMQWSGLSVFREGNIIDLGITQLQVVDACSGLRYVYPLLLMGFIFAYLFHRKWWERIIIILMTLPISVFSNALRIAITGYLTIHVSPQLAESFFHGFSGWLIFMFSFIFLCILSWLLKWIWKRIAKGTIEKKEVINSKTNSLNINHIKILYLWISTGVFLGFWGLNTLMASSQITPVRESFESFPDRIGDWQGERDYLGQDILESLWADDYILVRFMNPKTDSYLLLLVSYYEYQKAMHTAHAPAACLIGAGHALLSKQGIEKEFPSPFGKIRIGQMVMEKESQIILANFWFQGRGRIITNEYLNKWYLFWDSIIKRRTDGALIRVEMSLDDGQSVEEAQNIVDGFIRDVMGILPEYVPG